MRTYLSYIKAQLILLKRDGAVLFLNCLLQLVFLAIFIMMLGNTRAMIARAFTMVLVIGVLGTGFFGAGLRAVSDREKNILRRLQVAPITPLPIIVSSFVTGLASFLPIAFIMLVLVHFHYHVPWPERWISLALFLSLGVIAFRAMGMTVAAAAKSMQESQIVIQLLYLPMLLLSGATLPVSMMPGWLQSFAQFIPSTHLVTAMQKILIENQGIKENSVPVLAMVCTTLVGTFVAFKLFRWDKDAKIATSAKVWIVIVFLPFLAIGTWRLHSRRNLALNKTSDHDLRCSRTLLMKNVRVFVGDGTVIDQASVLLNGGKIAKIYSQPPDSKKLGADEEEGAGKTLMPGLIDVDTYLGPAWGLADRPELYVPVKNVSRRLASYLFTGVTGVMSVGDRLGLIEDQARKDDSGEQLGAGVFYSGPIFAAQGGPSDQSPAVRPTAFRMQAPNRAAVSTLSPKTEPEVAPLLVDLKQHGVSEVKIVAASSGGRMDAALYKAIVSAAREQKLQVVVRTRDLSDLNDAIDAGATLMEGGSERQPITDEVFARMKAQNMYYDPTLSSYEALAEIERKNTELLDGPLVLGAGHLSLIQSTKAWVQSNQDPAFQQKPTGRLY